jgi:hypothetical protein
VAFVVGTGQMTVQPTQALVPVPIIAKEVATAGALLYVILQQQQHVKARQNLEEQCKMPVNKNNPLCQPFIDKTKPLPLADIQRWVTENCKKDAACIQKLVRILEELFRKLTGTTIHLGELLCKNPTFHSLAKSLGQYLLAQEFENYCKNKGFPASQSGISKPVGGTSGSGGSDGKSPISSVKPNSGAGGDGKTQNEYLGTDSELGERVKRVLYSAKNKLENKIAYYKRVLSNYDTYNNAYKTRYPKTYFNENLKIANEKLGIIKEILGEFLLLRERTQEMKKSKGKVNSRINKVKNNDIQAELQKLLERYEQYKTKKSGYPPGIKSEFGKKLTSKIERNIRLLTNGKGVDKNGNLIQELEKLLEEIEDLQDPLADEIDRMKLTSENKKREQENIIRELHENIQVKLREIDAKYKGLL